MRHSSLGVGFLQQTVSLPSHTFVSIYAIHWLQANMENMTYEKATNIMEVWFLMSVSSNVSIGEFIITGSTVFCKYTFVIWYYKKVKDAN